MRTDAGATAQRRVPTAVYAGAAALLWTAAVAASLLWNDASHREHVVRLGATVARAAIDRDLAFRLWIADAGGVYAPSDRVPPNPHLAHLEHRDLVTPWGQPLTLVNPAYATRLVHGIARDRYGIEGHLTSLDPVRAENEPQPWEREALEQMRARDEVERVEAVTVEGVPQVRVVRALRTEASCLVCHGAQGSREGDLRGGLSAVVPLAPILASEAPQRRATLWTHALLWLAGLGVVALGALHHQRRVRERERGERERLLLEQELQRARKIEALGRLSGGVAHDFNNLLTPICGYAQLVLEEMEAGDPRRPDLQEILAAAERARALVQRLLAFGRRRPGAPGPLDLAALSGDMLPLLQRVLGEAVRLRLAGEPGAPQALGDRHQLELALLELALNARDAMPTGGDLTIRTGSVDLDPERAARLQLTPGRHALLAVEDTGVGMTPQVQLRLFEPLFTTKAAGHGMGMGLASLRDAIRAQGGAIEVRSAPGQGTEVRLFLPAAAPTAGEEPILEGVPRGSETVLLVEDDEAVRRFAVSALAGLGYRVEAAGSAGQALERVRQGAEVALLVSDVSMPGTSGPELVEAVLRERPGLPVLFVSGYTGDQLPARLAHLPLLRKPFTSGDLARAVRQALDGPVRAAG